MGRRRHRSLVFRRRRLKIFRCSVSRFCRDTFAGVTTCHSPAAYIWSRPEIIRLDHHNTFLSAPTSTALCAVPSPPALGTVLYVFSPALRVVLSPAIKLASAVCSPQSPPAATDSTATTEDHNVWATPHDIALQKMEYARQHTGNRHWHMTRHASSLIRTASTASLPRWGA